MNLSLELLPQHLGDYSVCHTRCEEVLAQCRVTSKFSEFVGVAPGIVSCFELE
jgi:hypothetical protein